MDAPLPFRWEGDHFIPAKRFRAECDRRYVVGEVYLLGAEAERDMRAHRAYFASINSAFKSLPEEWGDFFKSAEHLRKWCLIQEGYCLQDTFTFANDLQAVEFMAYAKKRDQQFTVVIQSGPSVTIYVAESQQVLRNGKGMSAERFKQSKRDVQRRLDGMLGVAPGTVERQRESA